MNISLHFCATGLAVPIALANSVNVCDEWKEFRSWNVISLEQGTQLPSGSMTYKDFQQANFKIQKIRISIAIFQTFRMLCTRKFILKC